MLENFLLSIKGNFFKQIKNVTNKNNNKNKYRNYLLHRNGRRVLLGMKYRTEGQNKFLKCVLIFYNNMKKVSKFIKY